MSDEVEQSDSDDIGMLLNELKQLVDVRIMYLIIKSSAELIGNSSTPMFYILELLRNNLN